MNTSITQQLSERIDQLQKTVLEIEAYLETDNKFTEWRGWRKFHQEKADKPRYDEQPSEREVREVATMAWRAKDQQYKETIAGLRGEIAGLREKLEERDRHIESLLNQLEQARKELLNAGYEYRASTEDPYPER